MQSLLLVNEKYSRLQAPKRMAINKENFWNLCLSYQLENRE